MKYTVLVLGSGAREHAIAWSLRKSPLLKRLFVLPGNVGTAEIATNVDLDSSSFEKVRKFCLDESVDIVIVGSEEYLAKGIADFLSKEGIRVFGPGFFGALLESDRIYARRLCDILGIPSPGHWYFYRMKDLELFCLHNPECHFPIVVKDNQIAAGKGVLIANDASEALRFAEKVFSRDDKNSALLVEEYLTGQELSFFVTCHGKDFVFLGEARDYKKSHDGNTGMNTGGMGAVSPSHRMTPALKEKIESLFVAPILEQLERLGVRYVGVLFLGIMLVDSEPKLLEFNVRLGDPETQALLSRMQTDLLEIIVATLEGNLKNQEVSFKDEVSMCLVLASKGYPGDYKKGTVIKSLPVSANDLTLFHSNTLLSREKDLLAMGGRTMSIVSLGKDLETARKRCYEAVSSVDWDNIYYRKDVGVL